MTSLDSAKAELLDEIREISLEHDDEPLYSSFVRWVCTNLLDIDNESDIEDAISLGGPNDYDVDFFIHNSDGDEDDQSMSWGQVKFSETLDHSVTRGEMETFANGTIELGNSIAEATKKGAFSLVGGGDSVAAVKQFGFENKVSYVSTGGGAMLESLEGKILPGIAAILE